MKTTEVRILSATGTPQPKGVVGEIAIRGSHLFSGYFRRDDLTRSAMTQDGFYLTGDYGFVHDGDVYVTGRRKDLVIVQGRNFYPADIEAVVTRVEGVNPGRVVAFGLDDGNDGTQKLVILAEPAAEAPMEAPAAARLAHRIRNAVAQEIDFTPGDVRIVPPRWLVKSTSGKLARADNREKYRAMLSEAFAALARNASASAEGPSNAKSAAASLK